MEVDGWGVGFVVFDDEDEDEGRGAGAVGGLADKEEEEEAADILGAACDSRGIDVEDDLVMGNEAEDKAVEVLLVLIAESGVGSNSWGNCLSKYFSGS